MARSIRNDIRSCGKALLDALERKLLIGEAFIKAKERCGHGQWTSFLKECDVKARMASECMRFARNRPAIEEAKAHGGADFAVTDARKLLATPKASRHQEGRAEPPSEEQITPGEHSIGGQSVAPTDSAAPRDTPSERSPEGRAGFCEADRVPPDDRQPVGIGSPPRAELQVARGADGYLINMAFLEMAKLLTEVYRDLDQPVMIECRPSDDAQAARGATGYMINPPYSEAVDLLSEVCREIGDMGSDGAWKVVESHDVPSFGTMKSFAAGAVAILEALKGERCPGFRQRLGLGPMPLS